MHAWIHNCTRRSIYANNHIKHDDCEDPVAHKILPQNRKDMPKSISRELDDLIKKRIAELANKKLFIKSISFIKGKF